MRVRAEKAYLRNAAKIITVSDHLADILRRRHGIRAEIIPNGFDPEDYDETVQTSSPRSSKFSLTYAGALLLPQRDPRPVAEALLRLFNTGLIDPKEVSLDLYGVDKVQVARALERGGLEKMVKVHDRISTSQCVDVLRSSTVLLLLTHGGEKGIMTAKIFEYLAARRPILSVPKDRDCVDALLRETNAGVSCDSVEEIADVLLKWYREWCRTGTVCCCSKREVVAKYSREKQTERLSALLQECIAHASTRGVGKMVR
jgi:glycosyltransferase involved in cell wall biosynthesis